MLLAAQHVDIANERVHLVQVVGELVIVHREGQQPAQHTPQARLHRRVVAVVRVLIVGDGIPTGEHVADVADGDLVALARVGGGHVVGLDGDVLHDVPLSVLLAYNYIMPFTCGFVTHLERSSCVSM